LEVIVAVFFVVGIKPVNVADAKFDVLNLTFEGRTIFGIERKGNGAGVGASALVQVACGSWIKGLSRGNIDLVVAATGFGGKLFIGLDV
jgi:hypothetical protein